MRVCRLRKRIWSSESLISDQSHSCIEKNEKDTFEMQTDAIKPGQTVIVVDDLLATGMCTLSFASPNHRS